MLKYLAAASLMCQRHWNKQVNALDAGQYTPEEIRKYEAIYGRNFISPGGEATTRELLTLAALRPRMDVLEIGCGLGGAAFLLAQEQGALVHAIDLSHNMLRIARERCRALDLEQTVAFEHADILEFDRLEAYDLAHSRDVFLHIHAKARLFAVIGRCLRRGGLLLFTDYLCGAGPHSDEFAAYIRARNYDLHTLEHYRSLLEAAGFSVSLAEDRTAEFLQILRRELASLAALELASHERESLADSWRAKIARAQAGEQRWGVFLATKR
jgi:phosphoethanolamine N-methyltransferase